MTMLRPAVHQLMNKPPRPRSFCANDTNATTGTALQHPRGHGCTFTLCQHHNTVVIHHYPAPPMQLRYVRGYSSS